MTPSQPDLPARIGPYGILRSLGSGSMGEVHLAACVGQQPGLLAIKALRPELAGTVHRQRFLDEIRALHALDHPGVVRILDSGVGEDDRPYYAMEYMEGPNLERYCRDRRLGLRARLELFLQVCDAVHHAHERGIVHRDLKPENVLIRERGGRPQAVLIDFGLASLAPVGREAGDGETPDDSFVGTLPYMSPEQADPTLAAVDRRSDVYSLGVLLYLLLTSNLPLDEDELTRDGFAGLQRTLREAIPELPSARVAAEAAESEQIGWIHGLLPRLRAARLRGTLDGIVMRALAKDPGSRYATARELAEDVRGYLASSPLAAPAGGAVSLLGKDVAERSTRLRAAAALLVTLLGGLALRSEEPDEQTVLHAWRGLLEEGQAVACVEVLSLEAARLQKDGRSILAPPRIAESCAKIPVQVMFAESKALG